MHGNVYYYYVNKNKYRIIIGSNITRRYCRLSVGRTYNVFRDHRHCDISHCTIVLRIAKMSKGNGPVGKTYAVKNNRGPSRSPSLNRNTGDGRYDLRVIRHRSVRRNADARKKRTTSAAKRATTKRASKRNDHHKRASSFTIVVDPSALQNYDRMMRRARGDVSPVASASGQPRGTSSPAANVSSQPHGTSSPVASGSGQLRDKSPAENDKRDVPMTTADSPRTEEISTIPMPPDCVAESNEQDGRTENVTS